METVGSANGRTGPVPYGGSTGGRLIHLRVLSHTAYIFVWVLCERPSMQRTVSAFFQVLLVVPKRQLAENTGKRGTSSVHAGLRALLLPLGLQPGPHSWQPAARQRCHLVIVAALAARAPSI